MKKQQQTKYKGWLVGSIIFFILFLVTTNVFILGVSICCFIITTIKYKNEKKLNN